MKAPLLKTGIAVVGLGVVLHAVYYFGMQKDDAAQAIASFEECAAAGYPIMESYPEQCRAGDGQTFVRDISDREGEGIAW